MPYMVVKRGKKWKVYKEGSNKMPMGDMLGEHDSEAEAKTQVRAIYANENKSLSPIELDELEIKCYGDMDHLYVPYGINSFEELDTYTEAMEKNKEMGTLFDAFTQISYNILGNNNIEDKTVALQTLVTELGRRTKAEMKKEAGFIGIFKKQKKVEQESPLMLWKDADETYKWFGVYSNAYLDKHKDILTEESHLDFMKAIDSGEWDYPNLLLWHVPYAVIGKATMMGYDPETGFAYAGGTINKGMEKTAEFLIDYPDKGMSHGMPKAEVVRDQSDRRLIKRYRSVELSILPKSEAANELTVFQLEDNEMKFNEKARDFLKAANIDVEFAEKQLDAKAEEAKGIERKEEVSPVVVTTTETPVVETPIENKEALTKADFQTTMADLIKSLDSERFSPILEVMASLQKQVQDLTKQLGELNKSDEEKIVEKANTTTNFSIAELLNKSAFGVGKDKIEIDGRSALAKDTPEIAKAKDADTPFNRLTSGKSMRRELQEARNEKVSPTIN